MAPATLPPIEASSQLRPRVLLVDDEPEVLSLLSDILSEKLDCHLLLARNLAEARAAISGGNVDLLLTDLNLPDGDGMALVHDLRQRNAAARAVVITGQPNVENTVLALRQGVLDFIPKPFKAEHFIDRVERALRQQTLVARNDKRLARLKSAVRRLNQSRRMVSKKVDLLCNDLVSAYGDLSRQVGDLRNQESFRKLIESSSDLEQMLCHAMDWILRNTGYCNLAVWLAADDADFQLGAYMKYTIPGDPGLTEAIKKNLVPMVAREGLVHIEGHDTKKFLSPAELKYLNGQTVLATNCTYLGESLAVLAMFRDEKSPFTDDDVAMLRAIAPVFATALAAVVRKHEDYESTGDAGPAEPHNEAPPEDDKRRRKEKERHDADWWKRGEPPPF